MNGQIFVPDYHGDILECLLPWQPRFIVIEHTIPMYNIAQFSEVQ